jgi:hypothetical protein
VEVASLRGSRIRRENSLPDRGALRGAAVVADGANGANRLAANATTVRHGRRVLVA